MSDKSREELEKNINNCYIASSEYSSTLSSICRQIAFAEGALFWLLYTGFSFSSRYIIVGYLFLLFYFFTDLFQYLFGFIAFKKKAKQNEKYLENKIIIEKFHTISDDDLYWVYKALHLKLIFIALSSSTIILIFSFLLICNIK
jgi:hypothetical protein